MSILERVEELENLASDQREELAYMRARIKEFEAVMTSAFGLVVLGHRHKKKENLPFIF